MRRSDFIIKLMSAVLFLAIVAYIGIYIYKSANKPIVTVKAVKYTVEDSGSAEGYIVRDETVLTEGGSTATLMVGEGEKVAAGQAVAVLYGGESALERASEIRELQLQIKEAEKAVAVSAEQKTANAGACILALSNAVQHKDLSTLQDLTLSVKTTIFTKNDTVSAAEVSALKATLSGLLAKNTDTTAIYVPMSGVFSSVVDGYEAIGPEQLDDLTPSSMETVFAPSQYANNAAFGKLITGITWYYAAIMDAEDAHKLEGRSAIALQFTKTYNARLTMQIESVGAEENGKCVVVFSAKRNVSNMTALRRLTADIEFSALTGLLVPKEAVYLESDGRTYIFLHTGLQCEQVYVDILSENGDDYIVKDGTENNTVLRSGSDVIIKGKDLYDGKVVGR